MKLIGSLLLSNRTFCIVNPCSNGFRIAGPPRQEAEILVAVHRVRAYSLPAMAQPEAYIGGADKLFDASGKLVNDGTRRFLEGFMQAYAAWVSANVPHRG